jgi:hypothetical protein
VTLRNFVFLLSVSGLLCGCGGLNLSREDKADLKNMRAEVSLYDKVALTENSRKEEETEDSIRDDLIGQDPDDLAEAAAKRMDYRLISISYGPGAEEKEAVTFGVKCAGPVQTKQIYSQSRPVLFKLVRRYNMALIKQPGFPQTKLCETDNPGSKSIINVLEGKAEKAGNTRTPRD